MSKKKYNELEFEEWIEYSLLQNGYHRNFTHSKDSSHLYDRELCLIGEEVLEFIKSSQKEEYDRLFLSLDTLTDSHILKTIDKTIKDRGIIKTLRDGIDTKGVHLNLVYFQPKSSLNLTHQELYSKNRFTVVRQLHYSTKNSNSIDMVIFLNGIPIISKTNSPVRISPTPKINIGTEMRKRRFSLLRGYWYTFV
jgi:type I restriction enzyme, R subunit